jgi:hypothetical protein
MVMKTYKREVDKKIGDKSKQRFSEKQKHEALVLYKMTGNGRGTARSLGIPERTFFDWKASQWWKDAEADYLLEKRTLRKGRLEKLVDLASNIAHDRLEHGDWYWNPVTKALERRPVSALTASRILSDSLKAANDQEDRMEERRAVEDSSKLQDRMTVLMQEMINFAKSGDLRRAPSKIIDAELVEGGDPTSAEVSDAIHDERETRLLEGKEAVRGQAPGTDEEEGREQPSPSQDDRSRESAGG